MTKNKSANLDVSGIHLH